MGFCSWIACFLVFYVKFSYARTLGFPLGFPTSIVCRNGFKRLQLRPKDSRLVTCVIRENGTIAYNHTGKWNEIIFRGIFFDVTEITLKSRFNVKLNWSASSNSRDVKINEKDTDSECHTTSEARDLKIEKGKSHNLGCEYADRIISEEQFSEFRCDCYKDCVKFTDGYRSKGAYRVGRVDAGGIELNNISYEETPGIYRCALRYKNRTYFHKPIRICVKSEPTSVDVAALLPNQTHYEAVPGQNLTVACIAKNRESSNSVVWKRLQNGNVQVAESCTAIDEQELKKRLIWDIGDTVATYTLRNLKTSDSGTYSCTLINKENPAEANFTITVREQINYGIDGRIYAVIAVVVFLFSVVICLVTYRYKKQELKYIWKKLFVKAKETDEAVAYLIYSSDVFTNDQNNNPLKHVTEWLTNMKVVYNDPNDPNSHGELGGLIPESAESRMAESLSLIIFVTNGLLSKNEIENLLSYLGFDRNVETSQPVIFICTKEVQKQINLNENNDRTLVTFRNFMKRPANTVIHWTPEYKKSFFRRLYVALPKVTYRTKQEFVNKQQYLQEAADDQNEE